MHVHLRAEVESATLAFARTISPVIAQDPRVSAYLVDHGGLQVHTQLQAVFGMRFPERLMQVIHELAITHAVSAERAGPGAFDVSLRAIVGGLLREDGVSTTHDGRAHPSTSWVSRRARYGDLRWLVERFNISRSELFLEAVRLAGFRGRVVVERSRRDAGIEVVRGHVFEARCGLDLPSQRMKEARIACVDGFVESVAELHGFLEGAAEAKQPALLFVRGLSDDVKHTLKVNYDRGSLKVVPMVVRFDLAGVNTLADICTSTGGDLLSSNQGSLISSLRFDSCPVVEEAVVHADRAVIVGSRGRVSSLVADLLSRREQAPDPTVASLIDDRLRSLCPRYVLLRIPDDQDYVRCSQSVDYGLRAYAKMLSHGLVGEGSGQELAVTQAAAGVHARRCLSELRDLGAAVLT
jgi:hypothetical protein